MVEKRKERNAVKRKNALRLAICIIAFALWLSMFFVLANINVTWAMIELFLVAMVLVVLITKLASGAIEDRRIMEETENMEKTKEILGENTYTPIKCTINTADIQQGYKRAEALKSIVTAQEEVIKEFNYTLAAKLSEDKVLYAIVDENGDEIRPVDMYNDATFFVNNFEKI